MFEDDESEMPGLQVVSDSELGSDDSDEDTRLKFFLHKIIRN